MNVSLTPELEKYIKNKVEGGLYNNSSEVIREALRLAVRLDADEEWLRREAAIGLADVKAGRLTRVSNKEQFLALARRKK